MLTIDVRVAGTRVARRVVDAWSEKDHPRKAGKFVKKGEGVGVANALHEKHGVTGDHVIESEAHAGHGKTVREHLKAHGAKAAAELLAGADAGHVKFKAPAAGHEQHYAVHDPQTGDQVTSGTLKDIKKKGVYVYSKHAVAADVLGSAWLGGGALNNKGEHAGKTYVLKAAKKAAESQGGAGSLQAQVHALLEQHGSAASAAAPAAIDDWKNVGPQMGSNPGGVYAAPDGTKHYVKQLKSVHHVESERLANALYEKLGVHTSKPQHVKLGGKDAIASQMQPLKKFDVGDDKHLAEAKRHFVAHAFLANHDATGLHQDNHAFVDGKYATVDAGGSLKYRAQGQLKSDFGSVVDELNTMRDASKNAAAHAVFGNMTNAEIVESAKAVTSLSDEDIGKLVNEHMKSATSAERVQMRNTLSARRDDVAQRVAKMQSAASAKLGAKAKVEASKWSNPTPEAPQGQKFHAGPAASPTTPSLTQKFHVKTPLTNKMVAQGTIAELNAAGISTSEKQVKGATESGQHHLNSTFHKGEHKGQKYVLHKGEALEDHFHLKSPNGDVVKSGTLKELAAQGIHVHESMADYVNKGGGSGVNYQGKYHSLHKGAAVVTSQPTKKTHEPTPGSDDHAGSDDFQRPAVDTISGSHYLSMSKAQHDAVFAHGDESHAQQKAALSAYTGSSYGPMNEALRKGKTPKYGLDAHVEHLQKLAQRSKLQDDHVLWRGIKHPDVTKYLDVLKPGEHYVDPGFMSTSHNKSTARAFSGLAGKGHLMVIRARKGSSGIHAGGVGQHLAEHEVVLPHGTQLRYAGRSSEGHYVFDHTH